MTTEEAFLGCFAMAILFLIGVALVAQAAKSFAAGDFHQGASLACLALLLFCGNVR